MIQFQRAALCHKNRYEECLRAEGNRGCEYSFANIFIWGKQEIAFLGDCAVLFSHFGGRSVYPFPIGPGDKRRVLEEILADARERGIPCRITSLTKKDMEDLERWFPETFQFRTARDNYDYVYTVDALADLRGRKLQKKRNHFNRFCAEHPNYRVEPLDCGNLARVQHMVNDWYVYRRQLDPTGDYLLESLALAKTFRHLEDLEMEGLVLLDGDRILAVTMGTRLTEDTFDVHFEKAREDVSGAYNAINCEFARYIRLHHPQVIYLNREDDLGIEGLRKAKLAYQPVHLIEKSWACLREDIYEE